MRLRILSTLALSLAAFGAGCDPCFATSSCGASAPRLSLDGQLVRADNGHGVDGIRVDVLRRGGVALAADSFSIVTSGGGFWHVESPATAAGNVVLDFRVNAPALPHPYTIAGRSVSTVSRSGDAVLLERWVAQPYLNYYIDLFLRPTGGRLPSAPVSYAQKSTTWLTGASVHGSTAASQADTAGRVKLFPALTYFTDTGDVVGDLAVTLPSPYGTSVISGLRLHPTYVYHADPVVLRSGAGPSLDYVVQLFSRATGGPLAGVPFTATRTGGISVATNTISGVTDNNGYAHLHFAARGVGVLQATLTVTPSGQSPQSFPLSMPTFDSDVGRALTNIDVGVSLNYVIQVYDRATGKPEAGVPFTGVRVSGIGVVSNSISGVTDKDGYAHLSFVPLAAGTLTAAFTFTPSIGVPETYQFDMKTLDTDEGRLLANVTVGAYMNYYGLLEAGYAVPFAGVPVRIHWTGGVPMSPSDTTIVTGSTGIIPINSRPGAVGNATLELTFLLPSPYKQFMVKNIVLSTMVHDVPAGQTVWVWDVNSPISGPPGSEVVFLP